MIEILTEKSSKLRAKLIAEHDFKLMRSAETALRVALIDVYGCAPFIRCSELLRTVAEKNLLRKSK